MQILKASQFREIIRVWRHAPAPFVDAEHNGKDHWDPTFRVVCLSITGLNGEAQVLETMQIPLAHQEGENAEPEMFHALAEFFEQVNIGAFWVQSEAMSILRQFNVRGRFVDDPYISLRMLQDQTTANLKDAVAKYLNKSMTRIEDVIPGCIPGDDSTYDFSKVHAQDPKGISYSEADSFDGLDLNNVLKSKIYTSKMQAVYELEVTAAAILAEQTLIGYEIDLGVLERELVNEDRRLVKLQESVYRRLDCEPFPLNSTAKLGQALAKLGIYSPVKTKQTPKGGGGSDSWAKPVMEGMIREGLSPEHDILFREIVEWKSAFSVRNTLRKSPTRIAIDGRIHPIWKSIGYDGTARPYAENPSITSLPMGCRRAMRAPKGKRWMKFDWKQAELRALAAASQDENLIALLNSGIDVHKGIYSKMSGVPIEQITEDQREESKVISYSILYSGGSPYHVARALAVTMEKANELVLDYFAALPKLDAFLKDLRAKAAKTYHVRTFMNRLRRLDGRDVEKVMNQACDAMGQQTIGTALKIALKKMVDYHQMGHPLMKGLCQIIPVFDAIFYCVDSDVPVDPHVSVMRDLVQLNLAGVLLEAEFETGPTWGDVVEFEDGMGQTAAELVSGGQAAIDHLKAITDEVGRPTSITPEDEIHNKETLIKAVQEGKPVNMADVLKLM